MVGQLRTLGILQACQVLRLGFPMRVSYKELSARFTRLPSEVTDLFLGEPEDTFIAAMLWAFQVPSDGYRLGKTLVFFRADQVQTRTRT